MAVKESACRIIGGKWRGRKIKFDDAVGLRPTTDRIRETVFNWLQCYIHQSYCLDLFAGSGVLGFEALSRGAAGLVFVEQNAKTVKKIEQNSRQLDAQDISIIHADALQWLPSSGQETRSRQPFNLVFIDPPFRSGLLAKSCNLLAAAGSLSNDAVIYVEHAIDDDVVLPQHWQCIKEKRAGQVVYKLYKNGF